MGKQHSKVILLYFLVCNFHNLQQEKLSEQTSAGSEVSDCMSV